MEKSIKLIITGLLCSSIAAAQVADSIQRLRTGYLVQQEGSDYRRWHGYG